MKHESNYCPPGYADADTPFGGLAHGQESHGHQGSNNFSRSANEVRDNFPTYFNSNAGSVHWQWEMVLIELQTPVTVINCKAICLFYYDTVKTIIYCC